MKQQRRFVQWREVYMYIDLEPGGGSVMKQQRSFVQWWEVYMYIDLEPEAEALWNSKEALLSEGKCTCT